MSTSATAAAAGVSSSSSAPSSHSHSTLTTDSFTLELFLKQDRISALFNRVHTDYIDCLRTHAAAKGSLKALTEKCTSNGAFTRLPKSLSVDLISKVKFPTVAEQPNFFKATTDAIHEAQQKAEAAIYTALHDARQRYVEYTSSRCSQPAFIASTVANFKSTAEKFAAEYKSLHSAELPVAAAVSAFERHVTDVVTRIALEEVGKQIARVEAEEKDKADDATAQEHILAGAHNGNTIRAIAQQVAREEIRHARKQLPKDAQQLQSAAPHPRSAADRSSSHSSSQQQHKSRTGSFKPHTMSSSSHTRAQRGAEPTMRPADRKRKAAIALSDASDAAKDMHSNDAPASSTAEQVREQQPQHTHSQQRQRSTNSKGGKSRRTTPQPSHTSTRRPFKRQRMPDSAGESRKGREPTSTAMEQ